MTPLPKKKMSRARSLKRKGQIKAALPQLSPCAKCKKMIPSHVVCPFCGTYNKKSVVTLKSQTKTRIIKEEEAKS